MPTQEDSTYNDRVNNNNIEVVLFDRPIVVTGVYQGERGVDLPGNPAASQAGSYRR